MNMNAYLILTRFKYEIALNCVSSTEDCLGSTMYISSAAVVFA